MGLVCPRSVHRLFNCYYRHQRAECADGCCFAFVTFANPVAAEDEQDKEDPNHSDISTRKLVSILSPYTSRLTDVTTAFAL